MCHTWMKKKKIFIVPYSSFRCGIPNLSRQIFSPPPPLKASLGNLSPAAVLPSNHLDHINTLLPAYIIVIYM